MNNLQTKILRDEAEITRAAHWAMVEISLGSVGHGLKIPGTGQFLSLYQIYQLSQGLNRDRLPRSSSFEISGIVATFKSLSPAGQKLGPMLSIAMQGALYWFGTLIAGVGLAGQLLGATLSSVWAFLQPLFTYGLIFGWDLWRMFESYHQKLLEDFPALSTVILSFLGAFVFLKCLFAWLAVVFSYTGKVNWDLSSFLRVQKEPHSSQAQGPPKAVWRAALSDLMNPLFLVSTVLMVLFVTQVESDLSRRIWISLRPLAVAYALFYLVRSPWSHKAFRRMAARSERMQKFYEKAGRVSEFLKEKRK